MKKTLKIAVAAIVLGIMLLSLTGCGNKIVATKTEELMGEEITEILEVKFKGDEVTEATMKMEFASEETAETWFPLLKMSGVPEEQIELDGKKIVMTMTKDDFGKEYNKQSKDEIIKALEDDGYTVK